MILDCHITERERNCFFILDCQLFLSYSKVPLTDCEGSKDYFGQYALSLWPKGIDKRKKNICASFARLLYEAIAILSGKHSSASFWHRGLLHLQCFAFCSYYGKFFHFTS
jgi:hypothetical protein